MTNYNRDYQLKERLNAFLTVKLGLPQHDYYGNLSASDFLELKSALSDIHNTITLKVAHAFSNWLANRFDFDAEARTQIQRAILATKPNTNGYDIEITHPCKVIAEVKCNVPVNNGAVYGAAQKSGIIKDIDALMKGKSKSTVTPSEFLKFMVFLDHGGIRLATKHLIKSMTSQKSNILFAEESADLTRKDVVYIVFVEF